MTELLHFDEYLLQLINVGWQNPLFDTVMPLLRTKFVWFPLYLFLFGFLLVNFRQKGLVILGFFLLTVGLTDAISSQVIKKNVRRARPCQVYQPGKDFQLRANCGSGYSFPSSHAANHFGMAVFLAMTVGRLFRWIRIPLMVWATLIAIAQVYVGLHYPLDVISGAFIGMLVAFFICRYALPVSGFSGMVFPESGHFQNQADE